MTRASENPDSAAPDTPATDHATKRLLHAIDARAGVAVAFHLPTVRTVATDDQVRGMYFLREDEDLNAIEAIAMAPGGAAMLMKDGSFRLPPRCPVSQPSQPSLLQSHAAELEALGDLGFLCIGIGQIPGLPPVALALDFQDGWARGAAIFSSAPRGPGLELLAAVGVRILKTQTADDGRVLLHLENRLEAHFDAARLSSYQRTGNCNGFFLTHGTATEGIEEGLMDASRVRIAAGRERLAKSVIELASRSLDEGLALEMSAPGQDSTKPYGDLVPLGFLGLALRTVMESNGPQSEAAGEVLDRLTAHLERHRASGFWGYSQGCIPTSTDTALVALAGVTPDLDQLERLRGPAGGFTPQRCSDSGEALTMKRTLATAHWEEEDVPTTALIEALRIDSGLAPTLDAKWFLARFQLWGGLYFTPPMLGLWSMARISSRLGPWEPLEPIASDEDASTAEEAAAEVTADRADRSDQVDRSSLRKTILQMLDGHRNEDGGFGTFDPLLNNSLAILTLAELGVLDRAATIAQLQVLDAWERPDTVETPFHSTLALPRATTIEEIVAQQQLPASAVLHEHVHQASTYEDPHRLIGAAVACLALHVDADPAVRDRFLDAERAPAAFHRPTTPVEQAMRHVRGYCQPKISSGTDLNDPFCVPETRAPLLEAMTSSLDRLGPLLVSTSAKTRLLSAIRKTEDDHIKSGTFGVEVRLHAGDDAIDFLWCASRGSRNLIALLNQPDPTSRLRHLARLWDVLPEENKPSIAFIDNIWFEFDLDGPNDLPPAFFFGPSKIQTDLSAEYGVEEVGVNARRITRALDLDPGLADGLMRTADFLDHLDGLGVKTEVFQTGLMFSRPDTPIRLCFKPLNEPESRTLLVRLGLKHMVARCEAIFAAAESCETKTAICVDVTPDGVSDRVGLELHTSPRNPESTKQEVRALVSRLQTMGALDADRSRAFLESEGWDELSGKGGCNRRINHVKCVVRPTGPVETKGYLAFSRVKRPRN